VRQALSHAGADSLGKSGGAHRRTPGIDPNKLLLSQPLEQFHKQDWVATGVPDSAEHGVIGLSLDHVARHLRHGRLAERLEHEPFCTLVGEILDSAPNIPRALIRTHR
jgi:hypothetical protein